MSFLERLLGPKEEKASEASSLLVVNGNPQPKWMGRRYEDFAREGYTQNVVAYQCINMIGEAIASVQWSAWRGDTELSEHPMLELIKRPNIKQSYSEFMKAYIGFLLISGNGYVEGVDVNGETKELYPLRSDRMAVTPSAAGVPSKYTYKVGQSKHEWGVDPNTGESDIHHSVLFNPLDDWYGLSPISAGAFAVDQHNQSMTWMQSLLQNSARPSGALVSKPDSDLTDEQFNRLKTQIEEQYSGAKNAGRPMLLEGGLDWKQMGFSPSDMALLETKYSSARDIALAFGVPPLLLGIKGDNTFANYKEARLAFWEDTVIPMLSMIQDGLFYWLSQRFDGVVVLKPELDKIPAIAEKRQTLWDMADKSDDLTINERREIKGFPPIPGGDVVMVPATMLPLGYTPEDPASDNDQKALAKILGYDTKA